MIPDRRYDYNRYFTSDPDICDGETIIRGTRVTLRTILHSLAEGASVESILDNFPSLSEEDVRAAIAFAADSAAEDIPLSGLPQIR